MRSMSVVLLAAGFGLAAGSNIVNPATGMCLDIKAPCADGSDTEGCTRLHAKEIPAGTSLQAFRCHDEENQDFEIIGGQLRNPITGFCVDIVSGGGSGSMPDGGNLFMLQVTDCTGKQLWDFLETGLVMHEGTKLCMDIKAHIIEGGGRAEAEDVKMEAPVQVYTCHSEGNQIWDFETGDLAEEAGEQVAGATRLFQLFGDGLRSPTSATRGKAVFVAVAGTCTLAAALLLALRSRRSTVAAAEAIEPCLERPE